MAIKKHKLLIYSIFVLFFAILPIKVHALTEQIDSFNSTYTINSDATVSVKETIIYNFGDNQKHGIFRYIPINYDSTDVTRSIYIDNVSVADETGMNLPYTESTDEINVIYRIGDADTLVSGIKTYILQYRITGAINYFTDYDEFYWNVNGFDWEVPLNNINATVIYPNGTTVDTAKYTCFAGEVGSKSQCSNMSTADNQGVINANYSQDTLGFGENLTIVNGFPKNLVEYREPITNKYINPDDKYSDPGLVQEIIAGIVISLPLIVSIFMIIKWFRYGRDPKGRGTIVAQYTSPDNLTPLEIGAIMNDKLDTREITAELIYMAEKGYLKITRVPKKTLLVFKHDEYEIERIKDFDDNIRESDRCYYIGLSNRNGKISTYDLKTDRTKDIKTILSLLDKDVFEHLTELGYYKDSPYKVRRKYSGVGGGFMVFGVALMTSGLLAIIGIEFFISGFIIYMFKKIMPAKTIKGVEAKELALGLKMYISVAEKDRIEFHDAPKKDPKQFEELLPYAIALGVEKEWAKQFEEIYNIQPNWYYDSSTSNFNFTSFSIGMNSFNDSLHSVYASSNNSSLSSFGSSASSGGSGFSGGSFGGGGGFSGGGFGGGGGGSW